MLFYVLIPIIFALIFSIFCILKFTKFKNNKKFSQAINILLKVAVVVYCALMLLNVLMPDVFTKSQDQAFLGAGIWQGHAFLRLFSAVAFVTLPIAVFFKNRTIRNIAIYFTIAVTIVQFACYGDYINFFTSSAGKGLNSLPLSAGFKNFLLSEGFRGTYFGTQIMLQLIIPIVLAIEEKHVFNFKDKKEWVWFFICLPLVILSATPIYVPQYLFGYSNAIFDSFTILHFVWIFAVIGLIIALYFVFRKSSKETKRVLLFVLSLSLIMQYNQMFSAITLNIHRLPLQLCNIGAFLILIALITKNRRVFNFSVIINVVGVLFALAMPDLDGLGIFYLYNMHFIFEHTNVLVVPVLALCFGLFPRLDRKALEDCLLFFTIYFVFVWALGTMFNAIELATGNRIYEANWLFMFSQSKASDIAPAIAALFDMNFKIGYGTFYPVIQLLVYCVFMTMVVALFYVIRLIYLIKDKSCKKKNPPPLQEPHQQINQSTDE